MNQETQHFENDSFTVDAAEEKGCKLVAKVFLKPKAAQKAYQKAVKEVNKQISIPGFRKGHAPPKAVISRHSSSVEQEWKEIVVNDAYRAAIDLTGVYPISREGIDKPKIENCSQEEGANVRIAYEHYPNVPQIEFSKLRLAAVKKETVDAEKVEEILGEIQKSHADWEEVSDRAVKKDDFVDLTIDSLEEDPPKPIVEDRRFEVSDKRIAPWLRKLLVGMNIGDAKETVTEVDEAADERAKQNFKPSKVRVTLKAIKKIILPTLDDALAQKSGASSLEDLKQKIEKNLEKESEEEAQRKRFEALDEALLETYHFDLPASIVEAERAERISRKIQALKGSQSDDEIKAQEKAIEKEVAHELDQALRLYYLNKQLVKQGKIALTNEELNNELMRQISQNPYLYGKNRTEEETRDYISRLASAMMQRKAKEFALAEIENK